MSSSAYSGSADDSDDNRSATVPLPSEDEDEYESSEKQEEEEEVEEGEEGEEVKEPHVRGLFDKANEYVPSMLLEDFLQRANEREDGWDQEFVKLESHPWLALMPLLYSREPTKASKSVNAALVTPLQERVPLATFSLPAEVDDEYPLANRAALSCYTMSDSDRPHPDDVGYQLVRDLVRSGSPSHEELAKLPPCVVRTKDESVSATLQPAQRLAVWVCDAACKLPKEWHALVCSDAMMRLLGRMDQRLPAAAYAFVVMRVLVALGACTETEEGRILGFNYAIMDNCMNERKLRRILSNGAKDENIIKRIMHPKRVKKRSPQLREALIKLRTWTKAVLHALDTGIPMIPKRKMKEEVEEQTGDKEEEKQKRPRPDVVDEEEEKKKDEREKEMEQQSPFKKARASQ